MKITELEIIAYQINAYLSVCASHRGNQSERARLVIQKLPIFLRTTKHESIDFGDRNKRNHMFWQNHPSKESGQDPRKNSQR